MLLNAPFTQLSNLDLGATVSRPAPPPLNSLIAQLSQQTQQPLTAANVKATQTQARVIDKLIEVLVSESKPIDKNLRAVFIQRQSHDLELAQYFKQARELFLVKLQGANKSQAFVSNQAFKPGTKLVIGIDSRGIWRPQKPNLEPNKLLRQELRTQLPRAVELAPSLREFKQLQQQLAAAVHSGKSQLESLQTALNQLQKTPFSIHQLQEPSQLKAAIRQSGHFYERNLFSRLTVTHPEPEKLADSIKQTQVIAPHNSANVNLSNKITPQLTALKSSAFDKILRHLLQGSSNNSQASTPKPATTSSSPPKLTGGQNQQALPESPTPTKSTGGDLKAQLLIVKQIATTLLAKPENTNNAKTKPDATKAELKAPTKDGKNTSSSKSDKEQTLVRQIQQQAVAALAKIQLNQTHTLQTHLTNEGKASSPALQLEIPIRFGDDLQTLKLFIEEDWVEQEGKGEASEKIRQWRVNFCINLPDNGCFYATIIQTGDNTEVKLWSDTESLALKAKQHMQVLRDRLRLKGIHVGDIACHVGTPAQPRTNVSCGLVDLCL